MTDNWDELWEEPDARHANWTDKRGWIKRVKAEGDRLKEKAEKAKIIYEKTDKENCDLLYKVLTAQQKLEAAKTNLTHMVGILEMDLIHANTMIKIEYAQELLEILGEGDV